MFLRFLFCLFLLFQLSICYNVLSSSISSSSLLQQQQQQPQTCSDNLLSSSFVIRTGFYNQRLLYFSNPSNSAVCIQQLRLTLTNLCPDVDPFRHGLNFSSSIVETCNGNKRILLGYEGYSLYRTEVINLGLSLPANSQLEAYLDFLDIVYPPQCNRDKLYMVSLGVLYSV